MILRRAFRYWQFISAAVLPIWPFVGWGLFGDSGWSLLGLFIAMPILAAAMLIVALLVFARTSVRQSGAVSWMDVGLLSIWQVTIVGFGCFGPAVAAWAVLGIVAGLACFWGALWQLITETTRRAKATMADFERMAAGEGAPTVPPASGRPTFAGSDQQEVIVVHEAKPDVQR